MGRAQPWGVLLWCSNLLSLVGSGCLVLVCSRVAFRLGGLGRTPLFIRQLLGLASSDFLWAVWWFAQTGPLSTIGGDPGDCTLYITGLRFLQMLSVLSTVHIAAGLLAALKRRERVLQCLAKMQLATVPCALAFACVYLIWLPYRDEACEYCVSQGPSEAIFSSGVITAFVVTAAIHVLATRELLRGAPEEVAARSIQRAVHYLAAFLLCWSVFVLGCFIDRSVSYIGPVDSGGFREENVDLWHNLRDVLSSANGALNAAVYAGQNWRLLQRYSRRRSRRRRRRRSGSRGVGRSGDSSADAAAHVTDDSLHSAPGGTRPRGILAGAGSLASTPQRPSLLAPPACRGVAFSPSVLNGEPSCMLVTPRTAEVEARAEEQIVDLESRRSWLLLGADPLLLHDARLLVQGAGCPLLDGCYDLVDCQGGRPTYRSAGGNTIRWSCDADEWQLCLEGQHVVYCQEDDAPSPPAAGWLALLDDDLPGPTVWGPSGGGAFASLLSAAGAEGPPTSARDVPATGLDAIVASACSAISTEGSTVDTPGVPGRSMASAASDALG